MNDSKRQQKYARLLQKELGAIFQKDTRGILEGAFVTITHVDMSPDLSIAKVYISMMMIKDRESLLQKITSRKSEIRKQLGNKIGKQVRIVPDLIFYIDQVEERAMELDKLIDSLSIPPKEDEEEN